MTNDEIQMTKEVQMMKLELVLTVLLSVKVFAGRANFSERGSPGVPLPSTGRGNEGEGWSGRIASVLRHD